MNRFLFILLLPVFLFGQHLTETFDSFRFATVGVPIVYENFEGTGAPSDWGTNQGSPNFDYTSAPLAGSQSLFMDGTSADQGAYVDHTAMGDYWIAFIFKYTSAFAANRKFHTFNNGISEIFTTWVYPNRFRIFSPGTYGATLTSGTTYYFWERYQKGTGADAIYDEYIATTGTRPAVDIHATNGNGTADLGRNVFHCYASNATSIIDGVVISATEIGNYTLADGWFLKNHVAGAVTDGDNQGIVQDTVYTAIANHALSGWTITWQDSVDGGSWTDRSYTFEKAFSADSIYFAVDTVGTDALTVYTGSTTIATIEQGANNTQYIDTITLTSYSLDTGQDKGFKETPKFNKFPDWR